MCVRVERVYLSIRLLIYCNYKMSAGDILTDAAFTNVEITGNLIFRDRTFIDKDMNINAKTVRCDYIECRNIHILDAVVNDPLNFLNNNNNNTTTTTTTREFPKITDPLSTNEAPGKDAACLGGTYNEALGDRSVTVGGSENQAAGDSAIAMGSAAFATHAHTLVWNTDPDQPLETTADKQCMLASSGGLFFKLPLSSDVKTHQVPEGFACWCWDAERRTVALKTKQQNVFYKTRLETLEHEIAVRISDNQDENNGDIRLVIQNPDDT